MTHLAVTFVLKYPFIRIDLVIRLSVTTGIPMLCHPAEYLVHSRHKLSLYYFMIEANLDIKIFPLSEQGNLQFVLPKGLESNYTIQIIKSHT